jgi:hypothetical protein
VSARVTFDKPLGGERLVVTVDDECLLIAGRTDM